MSHRPLIYVIATQHLDVAYLWKRHPGGEDLMVQCFARAAEMMDAHPEVDFLFSRSTAWSFDLLERRDPALFARVRQAVAAGHLELCGGQWVEPDNLLPDGESLVRQGLYGQRYYLDTFGKTARVSWNPDAFAHGHTLPQLFRRAGLEAYYFHRCVPTDADGHLVDRFLWEGLDGSRVLVFAGHWCGRPDAEVLGDAAADLARSGQGVGFVATGANSDRRVTMETDWAPLLPRQTEAYEARWATAEQLVDALAPSLDQLPVVRGELGWQFTGTYTTEGRIKRRNRRLEALLDTAERLWADLWARGGEYPADELRHLRRELCVNQFHDIVCGTCYQNVHEEAFELYDEIEAGAQSLVAAGMDRAERAAADEVAEADSGGLLLFNPLGHPHRCPVFVRDGVTGEVVDTDGRAVPSQATAEGDGIVFLPPPVGSLRFTTVMLRETADEKGDGAERAPSAGRADVGTFKEGERAGGAPGARTQGVPLVLENPWLRAELDPQTGELLRLRDHQRDEEVLAPGARGNRLVFYADRTPLANYEPWYIGYTGEVLDSGRAEEVRLLEDGPVRARVQTRRRVHLHPDQPETVLIQDVLLYRELPWLVFETRGEWWADGALLKAEFDLAFGFREVTADMPYGVAVRPAERDTTAFRLGRDAGGEDGLATGTEVEEPDRPMHKWLDASNRARGLAFLNDGRYGYDADGRCVRLSLMRAPRHRDGELVGVGPFEPFSYALLPHSGDWRTARLPQVGLAYNYPLVSAPVAAAPAGPRPIAASAGAAPSERPASTAAPTRSAGIRAAGLFSLDADTVLVTAVKRAEAEDTLVLRLYESAGATCTTRVRSAVPLTGARVADLVERPTAEPGCRLLGPREVEVKLGPFEVKTLLLDLGAA